MTHIEGCFRHSIFIMQVHRLVGSDPLSDIQWKVRQKIDLEGPVLCVWDVWNSGMEHGRCKPEGNMSRKDRKNEGGKKETTKIKLSLGEGGRGHFLLEH
jgi:hypothetical protein